MAENTRAGTNIGAPVAANDSGDVLTYSLTGAGAASFDIVRSSGQLQTKAALDFETGPSYTVTVTATDPFGSPATSEVTITVTNVNEAPMFTAGATSIDHVEGTTVLDVDASNNNADAAVYTVTDEDAADDAADLKWSLSGADAGKFELTTTGATRTLSFMDAPDYESPGDSGRDNVYGVTVEVTDSEGNTAERPVTVKVINMEEAGVVELSTLQPRINFAITATLTDADNVTAGSVSWQWYKGTVTQGLLVTLDVNECVAADTNNCFIKGAASATYTPVANDVNDTLVAVALYTDGSPNGDDAKDFAMMVTANGVLADTLNKAPVFPQDLEMEGDQTDQVRMVGENVPVIGSGEATEPVRNVGAVVEAMDFITTNEGTTTDEVLTYSLGGPDEDSFSIDRSTAQISTKADVPLDKETKDTYTVTVTATDPSGLTATITVTIMVTNVDEAPTIVRAPDANVAPEFASATTSRTVAENTAAGEDIGNPVAATDNNGDTLTYALSGTDAASFDIDPDTGQLMTQAALALDYETKDSYEVMVTATDPDSASDMITVTVTVTNVEEPGMVTLWASATDALTMAPQVGDTITGAVMDPDGGVTVETWQWSRTMDTANMSNWMDIEDATGAAYMVTADDVGYYLRVMATYTDASGTDMAMGYSMPTMMVTMNAAPMFDAEAAERMVSENTAAGTNVGLPVAAMDTDAGDTLTYTLGGADMASFTIDNMGQIKVGATTMLDFETRTTYEVTVTATDPDSASDMITVTITVTNEEETGEVTLWAGTAALTMAPEVGDTITGAVMDPDGGVTVETWQWSRTMDTANMSSWMDIEDATGAAYMVTADDVGYYLRVMATYTDASGTDMEYSPATMMTIAAPMFESETDTREVPENTAAGEDIGNPVTATDADSATLTYTLGGTDAASFDIDPDTGQLMTLAALDHETKATYSVTVTASDSGGLSDSIDVTITVTDVDEDVAPADPLKDKYDANDNDEIERSEVFAAINDYLDGDAGAPTRADVFKLIELYLGD